MLRLKQCFEECGIPQKDLVTATGWSKTQISITFSTGRLPVNAERFRADVTDFAANDVRIREWLAVSNLEIADLFTEPNEPNVHGEIPGHGPAWACGEYGSLNHDYQHCRTCHRQYEGHLQRARGRAAIGVAAMVALLCAGCATPVPQQLPHTPWVTFAPCMITITTCDIDKTNCRQIEVEALCQQDKNTKERQ